MPYFGRRRGVAIESTEIQRTPVTSCSPRLQQLLTDAITRANIRPHYLPSGAGHDALMFDGITDIAMMFVRCGNGGISHSPLESITADDADAAVKILLDVVTNFKNEEK
jgi:acetylornithine deacetylase/succinyl-diaminopimelate desuccinylase-like protein